MKSPIMKPIKKGSSLYFFTIFVIALQRVNNFYGNNY